MVLHLFLVVQGSDLRLEERDGGWALSGPAAAGFPLVNEYLSYLVDRNYSSKTVRAYGYDPRLRQSQVLAGHECFQGTEGVPGVMSGGSCDVGASVDAQEADGEVS